MIIYSSILTKVEMDFDVSTTAQLKETPITTENA